MRAPRQSARLFRLTGPPGPASLTGTVRRYRNWIILAFVAALVAVSIYFIYPPGENTKLGLDLQGGVEVVYTAKTADGKPPTQDQIDQTIGIIDRRINGLGVTESQVQQQGTDQIAVALPGIDDPDQALAVIGKTAQLEFFEDYEDIRLVAGAASREEAIKEAETAGVPKKDLEQLPRRRQQHRRLRARRRPPPGRPATRARPGSSTGARRR